MTERFQPAAWTVRPSLKALLPGVLALVLGAFAMIAPPPAMAQEEAEEIRIGYLLSKAAGFNTGDRTGASLGEQEVNLQAGYVGKRLRILFATGGRSSEVVAKAEQLISEHGVHALMGSVSGAATIKLSQLAQERGLVFFNIGSDVDSLRGAKCQPNTFSIGPSLTMRVRALGQWVLVKKEWSRWAILTGESRTEGRLARAAAVYLEANGGSVAGEISLSEAEAHAPEPILSRLAALNPDFVYLAVTGEAQQLILEAYRAAGIETPIGGAQAEWVRFGRATGGMTGYWSAGWSHLNRIFGASELNNRYVDFAGIPMTERAWSAWAGVKILGESMLRAEDTSAEGLAAHLRKNLQFDGYMGRALNFRPWNQQLRQSMVVLRVNSGSPWNGWDALVPESSVPLRGLPGWRGNPLDSLGYTADETECTLN